MVAYLIATTDRIPQAFILALSLLAASVFADVTQLEQPSLRLREPLHARRLKNLIDAKESLSKRDDNEDIDNYNNAHQINQIPPYVTCNSYEGRESITYTRQDIWGAFQEGLRRMRNGQQAVYNARDYPHNINFADEDLQGIPIGNGDVNNAFIYPLVSLDDSNYIRQVYHGDGFPPGADRVVFDRNGNYMGVVTHRGLLQNGLHFAMYTDRDANRITDSGMMFPGRQPGYQNPVGGWVYFYKR